MLVSWNNLGNFLSGCLKSEGLLVEDIMCTWCIFPPEVFKKCKEKLKMEDYTGTFSECYKICVEFYMELRWPVRTILLLGILKQHVV